MRSVIGYYLVQQAARDRQERRRPAASRQAKTARLPLHRWLAAVRPERATVRSSGRAQGAAASRNAY